MIKFVGDFRALKGLGYKFKRLGSMGYMTWTLHHPDSIWGDYIRVWRSGKFLELCNYLNMSSTFIETVLDEELFESTKYEYEGRTCHAFMIDQKTCTFEKFILERHDREYILDQFLKTSPPVIDSEAVRIIREETENKRIFKIDPDEWIIPQIRKLAKLGMIVRE